MALSFMDSCCYGEEHVEEVIPRCSNSKKGFAEDALTVDHLKSTPLYDAIQRGDWSGVDFFLETGTFSFSPFHSGGSLATSEDQAETWVVCNDEDGNLLWRQLPIHAAICYGAPFKTIKELLKLYPASLTCADSAGNLPLHLAVKFNKPNGVLLLILKAFPDAMQAPNGEGDCPLDCASQLQDERARDRFAVFQTVVDNAQSVATREYEQKQEELRATIMSIRKEKVNLKKAQKELVKGSRRKSPFWGLMGRLNTSKKICPE